MSGGTGVPMIGGTAKRKATDDIVNSLRRLKKRHVSNEVDDIMNKVKGQINLSLWRSKNIELYNQLQDESISKCNLRSCWEKIKVTIITFFNSKIPTTLQ